MKKVFVVFCIFLFSLSFVFAKRTAPPEVQPIIHNKYEYIASYKNGFFSGKGIILIKNTDNSKIEKVITIYRDWYNPFEEQDAQWIFIKSMKLMDNGTIRIYNEDDREFELNLKKHRVKKIK